MSFFDTSDEFFSSDLAAPPEGRVEAVAKVTGKGKYSAEYTAANLCYGVLVGSTIAAGTIRSIDVDRAKQASGVIDILTHLHRPEVPAFTSEQKIKDSRFGLPIFHTDKIYFHGQPIALVIAETFEDATYAASLVNAEYDKTPFRVDFDKARLDAELKPAGKDRGNPDGWGTSPYIVEAEYSMKNEVHTPMEMHATIAEWLTENQLRLYDKTQGVNGVQRTMGRLLNIPPENIHVICEFMGGGFGSGLRVWPHTLAAALGAKQVKRPVKLVLTRPQMFYSVGYRPETWQKIRLGADADGKFTGILHQAKNVTSMYESFNDNAARISRILYDIPNLRNESALVPLNLGTPAPMRGPGDCTGAFAIESLIDELSYIMKVDPVELRMKNLALEKDPETGKPFSTNYVNEAIQKGARMIGWEQRQAEPGSMKEGDWRIGYGMAVGMWSSGRQNASAGITMMKDGSILVKSAVTDIGTGTGTGLQNMAAGATGIPKSKIRIELGNSDLPAAPTQGGSTGLSSMSGAMNAVCKSLKEKVASFAARQDTAYLNAAAADVILDGSGVALKATGEHFISYPDLFSKNRLDVIEVEASSAPGDERQKYTFCSSAAHFCRLRVNIKTGKVKIEKMVASLDGGKIINERPAANQASGAAVGGIGQALMEDRTPDFRLGNMPVEDLAAYHFAVNADAPFIEVAFVGKPDYNSNPNGSKGLGEVGIIGVAPAIANAIYNATGKRIRELPITPDKILA